MPTCTCFLDVASLSPMVAVETYRYQTEWFSCLRVAPSGTHGTENNFQVNKGTGL